MSNLSDTKEYGSILELKLSATLELKSTKKYAVGAILLAAIFSAYLLIPIFIDVSGDALILSRKLITSHPQSNTLFGLLERMVTTSSVCLIYGGLWNNAATNEKNSLFEQHQTILNRINKNWDIINIAIEKSREAQRYGDTRAYNYGMSGALAYFAKLVGTEYEQETEGIDLSCQMLCKRNYSGLKLNRCKLDHADFTNCTLKGVEFNDVTTNGTVFSDIALQQITINRSSANENS